MAQLMAAGSEMVDNWLKHAQDTHATTPELVAMMLIQTETQLNKAGVLAIMAATAIQRLVQPDTDQKDDTP